ETHGAALFGDAGLIGHQIDHLLVRAGVELARVGGLPAHHAARELDGRDLHAEAQPEVGHAGLAREACRADLAFDAAFAEAARHQHAIDVAEHGGGIVGLEILALDPAQGHARPVGRAGVGERLDHALVGV